MRTLLCIDPGRRTCGLALVSNRDGRPTLEGAATVPAVKRTEDAAVDLILEHARDLAAGAPWPMGVRRAVVEMPEGRFMKKQIGASVIETAAIAGRVGSTLSFEGWIVDWIRPNEVARAGRVVPSKDRKDVFRMLFGEPVRTNEHVRDAALFGAVRLGFLR